MSSTNQTNQSNGDFLKADKIDNTRRRSKSTQIFIEDIEPETLVDKKRDSNSINIPGFQNVGNLIPPMRKIRYKFNTKERPNRKSMYF